MPTLLLSTLDLPAAPALAEAARRSGWRVFAFDKNPSPRTSGQVVFYGGADVALSVAARFRLALLEPPLDLLTRLPLEFRLRAVEYGTYRDLSRLKAPAFIKPADPLNKAFDAGVSTDSRILSVPKNVDSDTPILLAEPVQWLAEYRCFILDKKVAAMSPYLSFGRPVWRPYKQGGEEAKESSHVRAFCERLFSQARVEFPPAFVMDVGLIEDRGWAVVEFNPVWCSGLLGVNPQRVLAVLQRACQDVEKLSGPDRVWVIPRGGTGRISERESSTRGQ
jgi:ATP-grasp domain-containing protein